MQIDCHACISLRRETIACLPAVMIRMQISFTGRKGRDKERRGKEEEASVFQILLLFS